jgi:hypothetical protein
MYQPFGSDVLSVEPFSFHLQDMNGGGIIDIVAQMHHGFFAWYGKGTLLFLN